ncbi:MAG: hypothetical protein HW384_802 [Dehalococcoidia bacterium]|nr:hypothetical protein [Dehalococcoidia bacterium]
MEKLNLNNMISTNDKVIRAALRNILYKELGNYQKNGYNAEVFEEFGVRHGAARIDFALINGVMCGYEIKSDRDTLERLPEQMIEFNAVFDNLTLVVGKRHLYQAMHFIPEWWGVMVAKVDAHDQVFFQTIRESETNSGQVKISIARLLWRKEALRILEERDSADGVRHKPREFIYERLANVSDINTLKVQVSALLVSREGWRSDPQLASNDD